MVGRLLGSILHSSFRTSETDRRSGLATGPSFKILFAVLGIGIIVGSGATFFLGKGLLHDAVRRAEDVERRSRILEAGLQSVVGDFDELEDQLTRFGNGIESLGELERETVESHSRIRVVGDSLSGNIERLQQQIDTSTDRFERIDLIICWLETGSRSGECSVE